MIAVEAAETADSTAPTEPSRVSSLSPRLLSIVEMAPETEPVNAATIPCSAVPTAVATKSIASLASVSRTNSLLSEAS